MNKYPNVPLGQICNIEIGRTPSRNQPKYWGNGYSWLSIADMKNFKFLSETKEQVTDLAIRECNMKLVPQGTLLFSFKLSVGKVGIASKDLFTNEAIAALKIKREKEVYQPFLYHALGSLNFDGKGDRAVKGITLNKAKLRELLIPLTPFSEQKRIAEILDKADVLRQKNKQLLAAYDELLQATFLEMFGDPVTNSKGWEKKLIKEIGNVVTGNTPPRANPENYGNYIEWIKTDNISTEIIYPTNSREFLSELGMKKGRVVPVGSILVTCIAGSLSSIGNCVIANREVAFNQQINSIIPKKCNSYFLYSVMQYSKKVTQDAATKGMKKLLIKSNFEKLPIICPPVTLQNQFAQIVENIEAQKTLVKQSLQESEDLFNGLVQKAFGGEL